MSWQLLTAISVVTFSVSVLLQRVLLYKDKSDPTAYVIIFQGIVGVLVSLFALVTGFEMPDFEKLWFPILATILLYSAENVVYAKALQIVEASTFSILITTRVFWLMLFGVIIFDEKLAVGHILGALLIFLSICLVAERRGALQFDKGIVLGLLTGLLFGLAAGVWAYVGRFSDAASWTALSFLGPSLVILISQPQAVKHMKPLFHGDMLKRMLALGIFFAISATTAQQAFQKGNVSLVAPVHSTTVVVTVLLAIVFLHERTRLRWKTTAAVVCFMGVLLIV